MSARSNALRDRRCVRLWLIYLFDKHLPSPCEQTSHLHIKEMIEMSPVVCE